MPVPTNDTVCRFIRETDWSTVHEKTKAKALKEDEMSLWHESQLEAQGATLEDLKIGELAGAGEFCLTVGDYLDIAQEVSLNIQVEWRPEDNYVKVLWRQWRDAHVQVEMTGDSPPRHFPPEFRRILTVMAKRKGIVPPIIDGQATTSSE